MDLRSSCSSLNYNELPIAEAEGSTGEPPLQRVALVASIDVKGGTGLLDWTVVSDSTLVERYAVKKKQRMMCAMLKDTTRNRAYATALKSAIARFKQEKKQTPLVLDIGTGSGFLAMLAAREGAEVVACEMNRDIASVAQRVIAKNGLGERIKVLVKRSTELCVERDLKRPVDIIVTETLDSQLLREDILDSLSHAKRHLSNPSVITIPKSASVFLHLCDAPDNFLNMHMLNTLRLHTCKKCPNGVQPLGPDPKLSSQPQASLTNSYVDVRENALTGVRRMSEDVQVFKCDFAGKSFGPLKNSREGIEVKASSDGKVRFGIMWWKLELDEEVVLETQAVPEDDPRWQDHWFQVLIPVEYPFDVKQEDVVRFDASHNQQSMVVYNFRLADKRDRPPPPIFACKETAHEFTTLNVYTRERTAQMGDPDRCKRLIAAMERAESKFEDLGSAFVDVSSDGFMIAQAVTRFKPKRVPFNTFYHVHLQSNMGAWYKVTERWFQIVPPYDGFLELFNTLNKVSCTSIVVMSDLYYVATHMQSVLSAINFFYQMRVLHKQSKKHGVNIVGVIPGRMIVKGALISAKALRRAQEPLGEVMGLNHDEFDKIWSLEDEHGTRSLDYSLWNYEYEILSDAFIVDVMDNIADKRTLEKEAVNTLTVRRKKDQAVDALMLWVECYDVNGDTDSDLTLLWSTHPSHNWYYQQKLYLIHDNEVRTSQELRVAAVQGSNIAEIDIKVSAHTQQPSS